MEISTITPRDLAAKLERGESIELIDVRTPIEYREVHCRIAKNIPLTELNPQSLMANRGEKPLYVICRSGSRGKQACEKLVAAGFTNVVNVEGGTLAWAECGLPVNRGKKAMSLERQVRIVAGLLVVAGVVMGATVHPYALGLAAFVGAGLVFAGVTDTCGMGMLLARMPWNQVATSSTTCTTPTPTGAKS